MPTGSGPITIERQGSFFVDGREVVAGGKYDGTASVFPPGAGQKYWIDQMYIQYQVPVNARTLPMVLVHGGGGDAFECMRMGLAAGARSSKVKAIVSYAPSFVFPRGEVPPPVPLFKGTQAHGAALSTEEFAKLAKLPLQVVFGDNIPRQPIADLPADSRRVSVDSSRLFVGALNNRGGRASLLLLPEVGLHGNAHFMYSDLNNLQVADQLYVFLAKHGLDARSASSLPKSKKDE